MELLGIFLMTPDASGKGGSSMSLIFMGLMILVFWLFMIRPQAKKAKQQKTFITDLKKGDKVVTIAGIHGKVNKLNEDGTLELEVSPGSYLKIEKSTISMEMTQALGKQAAAAESK
ncbi:MAG: preprotein translocase subunit YajC [Ferruginibacter sp.]